jgi:tetratricopeptide (TPR) repeat protein
MKLIPAALLALLATGPALGAPNSARAADFGAFLTARFAASRGNMDQAASQILTALDSDPGNPELQKDAFGLALLAGRPEADQLALHLPHNPIAQLVLADAHARAGEWERAELAYAELPHETLMDSLRPLLLAWSQQAQGHTDQALETLQAAIDSGHMSAFYTLHAALVADVARRDGLADRLYGELQKSITEPNVRLAQILASWAARSGRASDARALITKLAGDSPDMQMVIPGMLASLDHAPIGDAKAGIAESYTGMAGAVRSERGAGETSPLLLQLALRLQPNMTEALLVSADDEGSHNHYAAAAAALGRVSPSDPLSPVVKLRRAAYLARAGQSAEAQTLLEGLIAEFPNQAEPYARLGDIAAQDRHFADAVGYYSQAVTRTPHPTKSDWGLFYARGGAYERVHDWPRAEADMKQVLTLSPDQPAALNFLGYSWAEQGRNLDQARDMIQKALDQRPNDGAIIDSLGWVTLRMGDTHRAVHLLERAAELSPDDPAITGHLGDAYWELGRHVEAEDQWRRALVLNPDPDDAARIEARLKSVP